MLASMKPRSGMTKKIHSRRRGMAVEATESGGQLRRITRNAIEVKRLARGSYDKSAETLRGAAMK